MLQGFNCWKDDFITATVILLKSDRRPVCTTQQLWKLLGKFVNIRSIHEGVLGFLKHVVARFSLLNSDKISSMHYFQVI